MSTAIGTIIITVLLGVAVYTVFALLTNSNKGCCSQLPDGKADCGAGSCCGNREHN